MKRIFIFCSLAAIIIACSKDKFQTKPQITIKSVSSDIIPLNSGLRVLLEFTDKEGDVSDSVYFIRERLNQTSPTVLPAKMYGIPDFPNTSKGEIEVDLDYNLDLTVGMLPLSKPGTTPPSYQPDTMNLKFVVQDKAGNKSDTATAHVIVIR
jgi:hypothetical protein